MEELQPGDPDRIGQYALLGRLGAGGMGVVFLGRSRGGRLVAVKVVRTELANDPEFRIRFAREVDAARKVSGLFTAAVVDADTQARVPWLATNFVNGPSLTWAVAEHGALPDASVLALAAGLAEGLEAVHGSGVVHRDLKPSNVLLAPDGPLLIDFGISQAADVTAVTRVGMVVGSPGFMSPEQALGAVVGPASDVFSLGAVLAFAAAGEAPFGTGTSHVLLYRVIHEAPRLDRLPGQLLSLVQRCLAKDPAQRPSAAQFLLELTAAHPAAANLRDWVPAAILSSGSPLKVRTDGSNVPTATIEQADRVGELPDQEPPTIPPAEVPEEVRTGSSRSVVKVRRRWAIPAIAGAVILAAGVLVASLAPWKHPPAPVLRPTGLIAGSAGASEVALRWSSPATGPSPDRYEILRNGHRVGYAAGSVTSYRDTMLAPASSYSYQLIAIRDGKLSPPSAALAVDTVKPPVSDAVLDGKWDVNLSVTSTTHFNWGSDPKKWADKWAIQRACTDGPCNVTVAGKFSQVTFSDSLTRDGAVYAGTVPMSNFAYCTSSKKYMPGSLSIQITVDSAAVIGTAWTASSFRGSMTFTDTAGGTGCNVGKVVVSVAGTG